MQRDNRNVRYILSIKWIMNTTNTRIYSIDYISNWLDILNMVFYLFIQFDLLIVSTITFEMCILHLLIDMDKTHCEQTLDHRLQKKYTVIDGI